MSSQWFSLDCKVTKQAFQRLTSLRTRLSALEASVVRAYFESADRCRETDRNWLAKQCHKEYWAGYRDRLTRLHASIEAGDSTDTEIVQLMGQAVEEFSHYRLFAAIYQLAGDGSAPPIGTMIRTPIVNSKSGR